VREHTFKNSKEERMWDEYVRSPRALLTSF
jgi:hypothetical protein